MAVGYKGEAVHALVAEARERPQVLPRQVLEPPQPKKERDGPNGKLGVPDSSMVRW